jgi:gamma-glutamylcyclotransferase
MQSLYFAYGSNLCAERLRGRVASAETLGPAILPGRRLTMDKRGRDGSGKANVVPDGRGEVWGVVYSLHAADWSALDAYEAGYARVGVEVRTRLATQAEERLLAWTYVAEQRTEDPVPFDWYKRLIVEGARAHGLPEAWLARLEALPARRARR